MSEEPDRQILLTALVRSFGDDKAEAIMNDPAAYSEHQRGVGPVWDALDGCWKLWEWGMLIGVEPDGYVHT